MPTNEKPKREPLDIRSAVHFLDPKCSWRYRFPIEEILHPKYGRIQIQVEPLTRRNKFASILVSFKNHDIPTLKEIFEIQTPASDAVTLITSSMYSMSLSSFFEGTWAVGVCAEHKSLFFLSYAPDRTTALIVEGLTSSIKIAYEVNGACD